MTAADSPPSTDILVTANVSSIGGPPSVLLRDDGTNGDVTAGENVFSALVTVGAGTAPGLKTLAVTISDGQSRTATTSISLTVTGPTLVISQIYGGGGNAGAPYTNDYIEIVNRGPSTVLLSGLSLQYTSATGTGNFGSASNLLTDLPSGSLAPGQYWLVQEASGGANGAPLPLADVTDATPINMSATGGKVVLVTGTTSLGCNGGSTPCSAAALMRIIDLIGYDGANFFEGAGPAPTLANTTAALRADGGCTDTNNNSADFAAGGPSPRNSLSPFNVCGADQAASVASTTPANGTGGVPVNSNISLTFSEPVDATNGWYTISCATSGGHSAAVGGGQTTFTLDPDADFAANETCTVTVHAANVTDQDVNDPPDAMAADYVFSFTTEAPPTPIHDIQGATHISTFSGQTVTTLGRVTAKSSNGFWMQDPNPDADPATSEGIFVFTSSPQPVSIGDAVGVRNRVQEFRPGGASNANLTTTELSGSPTITVLSSANPLPPTTIVGTGGRIPPDQVIEDDAAGSVETSGTFDPAGDGLDFWESLEGMRLQLDNPVAVGPTNAFGETPVIGDDGANASVRT